MTTQVRTDILDPDRRQLLGQADVENRLGFYVGQIGS